jgi:hypothetical protein
MGMAAEHIGVAMALKFPLMIAITKVDLVTELAVRAVVSRLAQLLTSSTRRVILLENKEQLTDLFSGSSDLLNIVPVFLVSSVTGAGLDVLRSSLFNLPTRSWIVEREKSSFVRILTSYRNKGSRAPSCDIAPEDSYAPGIDEIITSETPSVGVAKETPLDSNAVLSPSVPASFINIEIETAIFLVQIQTGCVNVGQLMFLGPVTRDGRFCPISVCSIRVNNIPVRSAMAGQCATVMVELVDINSYPGLKSCHESSSLPASSSFMGLDALVDAPVSLTCRRRPSAGLVMLPAVRDSVRSPVADSTDPVDTFKSRLLHSCTNFSPSPACMTVENFLPLPAAHWEFSAEILVLNHPAKIRVNYEPVVHIGAIKQSARILSIQLMESDSVVSRPAEHLESCAEGVGNGQKALIRFKFLHYAEFVVPKSNILIREGRTRGVGVVLAAFSKAT